MKHSKTKRYKTRLKGFTILEAIISMVLTSLLVLLALAAIRYYQRLFWNVQRTGTTQTEINLFHTALNQDMQRALKVVFDSDLVCLSGDREVRYQFLKEKIVRNSMLAIDTFHIKYTPPLILPSPEVNDLVGQITVGCYNGEALYPVCVIKKYPLGLQFETLK